MGRDYYQTEAFRQVVKTIYEHLSPDDPMRERDLLLWAAKRGIPHAHTKRALSRLHSKDEIRWVAMRGWCRGGRPT